jgi:hypothetical protein
MVFVIEDEIHAEWCGQYVSFEEAMAELRRRATIPWDEVPNVAPCGSWQTCGREYLVIEYDDSQSPWAEVLTVPVFDISSSGLQWADSFAGR